MNAQHVNHCVIGMTHELEPPFAYTSNFYIGRQRFQEDKVSSIVMWLRQMWAPFNPRTPLQEQHADQPSHTLHVCTLSPNTN